MRVKSYKGRTFFECGTCGKTYSCKTSEEPTKPNWFRYICRACLNKKTPRKVKTA